jgi:hypothetical protein
MLQPSRRSFLGTLAAAVPAAGIAVKQKSNAEPSFRFAIAGCEFDLTVKPYGKVSSDDFAFIDQKTKRRFCMPANSTNDGGCVAGFRGAMSIALYTFHRSFPTAGPCRLREHVITIDHDSRINAHPAVEEYVTIEQDAASDIQAFGFTPDNAWGLGSTLQFVSPWALMRQDLYFDDQKTPVLILHWKHTLETIVLVDVIPGDKTRVLAV